MAHSDTRAPRLARIYLSMAQMLVEFRSEHVLTFFAGKSPCFLFLLGNRRVNMSLVTDLNIAAQNWKI